MKKIRKRYGAAACIVGVLAAGVPTVAQAPGRGSPPALMILSRSDPALAINAWGGARHGTILRLHNGCQASNPDCRWIYRDGMLLSARNERLAINAWGGATHGTILRLHEGCVSTNPDCTWTLRDGMFVSGSRNGRFAINAWDGALHGTVLRLNSECQPRNSDCAWIRK
jgi:hypothetical protein